MKKKKKLLKRKKAAAKKSPTKKKKKVAKKPTRLASKKTKKAKKKVVKKARAKKPTRKAKAGARSSKAPVISESAVQALIEKGRARGFVTHAEMLAMFPNIEKDIVGLETLYERLEGLSINVIESSRVFDSKEAKVSKKRSASKPSLMILHQTTCRCTSKKSVATHFCQVKRRLI